jgi:hypothetical protein
VAVRALGQVREQLKSRTFAPLPGGGERLRRRVVSNRLKVDFPDDESMRGPIRDGGADFLGPHHTPPPIAAHQPLHGAAGHWNAQPMEMSPRYRGAIQRLRAPPAVLIGL